MFKSHQAWLEDISDMLVVETLKIIDAKTRKEGDEAYRQVSAKFVERFIAAIMYKTLTEEAKINLPIKVLEDLHIKNANDMKRAIQDSVSQGFQYAMTAYSGKPMEYYCQIKLVPQPFSTKIN